eukprot:11877534-Prorocentrum_lima.AAC.1
MPICSRPQSVKARAHCGWMLGWRVSQLLRCCSQEARAQIPCSGQSSWASRSRYCGGWFGGSSLCPWLCMRWMNVGLAPRCDAGGAGGM